MRVAAVPGMVTIAPPGKGNVKVPPTRLRVPGILVVKVEPTGEDAQHTPLGLELLVGLVDKVTGLAVTSPMWKVMPPEEPLIGDWRYEIATLTARPTDATPVTPTALAAIRLPAVLRRALRGLVLLVTAERLLDRPGRPRRAGGGRLRHRTAHRRAPDEGRGRRTRHQLERGGPTRLAATRRRPTPSRPQERKRPVGHRSLPIRQHRSGRWQARPTGVDPATFDSYDEAEAWCLEQLVARGRGTAAPPGTSRLTFRTPTPRNGGPRSPGRRARGNASRPTCTDTCTRASAMASPLFHQAAADTAPGCRHRPRRGFLAPSSVGTVVQHLRQVLNGAVADRIIAGEARHLHGCGSLAPTMSRSSMPTPRAGARHHRHHPPACYRALVAVGAGLGLRQGEAFALRRSSIDFLRRQIHVRSQIVRPDNGAPRIEDTTKTGRARTVPLPDIADRRPAGPAHRALRQRPSCRGSSSPRRRA